MNIRKTPQDRRERRKLNFRYEGKFFIVSVLLGCLFGVSWRDFIHHYHIFKDPLSCIDVGAIKKEANSMLLSYIDGKWSSSIGDLIIKIDNKKDKNFMVMEMEIVKDGNVERKYKITDIIDVNGILGIVKLNICEIQHKCEEEQKIPIQINKVFGKDKTITVSYDSRLTYCIDSEDQCTRAFKRLNN